MKQSTYEFLKSRKEAGLSVVPERIVCAANRDQEDGQIFLGVRHGDEIMLITAGTQGKSLLMTDQGFYTNWQRFVTREEAMKIAKEQNQIFRPDGTHNDEILYSECLY